MKRNGRKKKSMIIKKNVRNNKMVKEMKEIRMRREY